MKFHLFTGAGTGKKNNTLPCCLPVSWTTLGSHSNSQHAYRASLHAHYSCPWPQWKRQMKEGFVPLRSKCFCVPGKEMLWLDTSYLQAHRCFQDNRDSRGPQREKSGWNTFKDSAHHRPEIWWDHGQGMVKHFFLNCVTLPRSSLGIVKADN